MDSFLPPRLLPSRGISFSEVSLFLMILKRTELTGAVGVSIGMLVGEAVSLGLGKRLRFKDIV